jgi:hypothetical protein
VETFTSLESSTIYKMSYDEERYILEIQFQSREIYKYFHVPQFVWEKFKSADSFGQFFNRHIKNNYPFERLS